MKTCSWPLMVLALACFLASGGCKKSNGGNGSESRISGKPSDAPIDLTQRWKTGQRYVMRMESAQTMQMPDFTAGRGGQPAGGGAPLQNNFAQEYSLVVTNSAETNRGMELEILAIELQVGRGDQQQINYDSRNKVVRDAGPMTDVFDRLIGAKIHYLVSPANQVLKVEGIKELFERVEGAPGDPAAATPARGRGAAAGASTTLRGIYSEEFFKQMIEMSSGPPNSVRVGESWTVNREINQPTIGKMLLTLTNTFRGWQEHDGRKCARVEFIGGMSSTDEGTSGGPMPMRMSLQGGSLSGHNWFSTELGASVETAIDQKYVINMSGPLGQPPANGATENASASFSMPVRQNVTVKLLEAKAVSE